MAAAVAAAFLVAVSAPPTLAQTQPAQPAQPAPAAKKERKAKTTTTTTTTGAEKAKKPRSPKQQAADQKMRECAAKWKEHKKTSGEKGRKAYNAFMSTCRKGAST